MPVKTIALAGNPNVGKSTVFNSLTGMKQHTGNWTGKTVSNAFGKYSFNGIDYTLVDLPGTYSLLVSSKEEAKARDFLLSNDIDAVVVVADATCLERNLNLALQILELTNNVIICVNLLDEAKKKGIHIDLDELSLYLGVEIVGTSAGKGEGLGELKEAVERVITQKRKYYPTKVVYNTEIEKNITAISATMGNNLTEKLKRYYSLRLLEDDIYIREKLTDSNKTIEFLNTLKTDNCYNAEKNRDSIVNTIVSKCEYIYHKTVTIENLEYKNRDRKIDRILTSKLFGIPIILLLMAFIFWLTIVGANYPSQWLTAFFELLGTKLTEGLQAINTPDFISSMLIDGVYTTTTWVVAVMLPPMAIFFPLFTLLEDLGYLPRIAFNMDSLFKKAHCHGKQSLTMCMGFGCNACGVTGCRIIDSPRERLIAIITNSFMPCNGRFPAIISLISIFFAGTLAFPFNSLCTVLVLMLVVLLGIVLTFLVARVLSATILKGESSSFVLELPPFRKPQIGKIIIRSLCDRTLFVLGRAVAVAAPAGLIIWLLTNIQIGNQAIIEYCIAFLAPIAPVFGMDSIIIIAFILGFPANEIVIPIMIMLYTNTGVLREVNNITQLQALFTSNGWTLVTAICVIIFYLAHFPCSTTCISIYKETKSIKWTLLSFIIPLFCGLLLCFLISGISNIYNYYL
ncbi:MAG: ferrous iron transport protein B [Acutalibacteraceae bacterium]|nr:ferrous iron transport protein B [Acutalibacteraceae bacterium]